MNQIQEASQFDRLPPHSLDAETALLGSLMLAGDDKAVLAEARAMVTKDSFYIADHAEVFAAICDLADAAKPVDIQLLVEKLKKSNVYEEIGGAATLARLMGSVPSYSHSKHYAAIVREKALLRWGIRLCNTYLSKAYAGIGADDVAVSALQELAGKAARLAAFGKAEVVYSIQTVLNEFLSEKRDEASHRRIATGIGKLDAMIGGLRRGGKTLIGGRASMGKSQLIKQILRNIAGAGVPVGYINIEETRQKITENLLASESGIPNNRIAFRTLDENEWGAVSEAAGRLWELPIYMVDSMYRLADVMAAAHLLACQYKCQVIAVDHLHIIESAEESAEQRISNISSALKRCWKELGVAGLEAAQLNRAEGKSVPSMRSLRGSGSLEADGDVILLLHRDDYYRRDDEEDDHVMTVNVAKNKDSATGLVYLSYDAARQRVEDGPEDLAPGGAGRQQPSMYDDATGGF